MTRTRTHGAARPPRRRRAALIAVAALAACLPAAPADAGSYSVWSCRGPDGAPVGTAAWSRAAVNAAVGDVLVADSCVRGGSLRLALASDRAFHAPVVGSATFAAPPGTRILGYELFRALEVAHPRLVGSHYNFAAAVTERVADGGVDAYGCATYGAGCHAAGDPGQPLAHANRVRHRRSPLTAVGLRVGCAWDACGRPSGAPARIDLYRSRVDLEDPFAPAAPRLSGTLAGAGPVSGIATLEVAAVDEGAGVRSISLAIDGGTEQTESAGTATCREPYTVPAPCPHGLERSFSIDTTGLADGAHVASGTVIDAAGNARSSSLRFTTRNRSAGSSPPAAPNGTPAVEHPRLRLASRRVAHRPGRAARIHGRLLTADGQPVAGARLTVRALTLGVDDDHQVERELPAVTTGARGAFTVRWHGVGAHRITVAFAPRPGVVTEQVAATVRSRLSLRLSSRRRLLVKGRSMTLRGRIAGAGASADGALLQIQAIVNGRWTPVGAVRARGNGSFRWRYRFVHLSRDTIFTFRAVVERVPGWPWPAKRSRKLTVQVDVP